MEELGQVIRDCRSYSRWVLVGGGGCYRYGEGLIAVQGRLHWHNLRRAVECVGGLQVAPREGSSLKMEVIARGSPSFEDRTEAEDDGILENEIQLELDDQDV